MSVNIATTDVKEAPVAVAVGGGLSVPVTETAAQALGGTVGTSEYPFKIAMPLATMTSGDDMTPSGAVLAVIPLDGEFGESTLINLKKRFMFYKIKDVTLVLKCISPWRDRKSVV